jgi:hypothetical protein
MPTETFKAIAVSQREGAPPFYLASMKAVDLLKWADAPRKKVEYMAGYQRQLDEVRTAAIKDFIEQDVANILPSATLVAIDGAAVEVGTDVDGVSEVRVSYEPHTQVTDEDRMVVLDALLARLDTDELASIGESGEGEAAPAIDEDDEAVVDDPESGQPPASYLAALARELRDYESLSPERRESLDDYVRSLEKPGLILDGQHRVFGAKDVVDDEVSVPVILLPGMPMQEQVFHFYVLNNKARPIDKTQLRAIIATSLSNKEIEQLYDRFAQAKLDADESRWTFDAHTREESPWRGLISFGLEGEAAPLKENVAHQLVARFVKMPKRYAGLYTVPEWPDPEYRLRLFFALWRTVKDVYPNAWEAALEGQGNLFKKVGLVVLQDFILDTLVGILPFAPESPFTSEEQLTDAVRKSLHDRLAEDFFLKEWQEKSLDTRGGQEFLLDQMQKAATPGTQMGKLKLFRDTSAD